MKQDSADWPSRLVPAAGGLAALYLVGAPLIMLIYAAFRGPSDFLPFEPGAHWTFDNVRDVFREPLLYTKVIPETFEFVAGTVTLTSIIAFSLAWLVERTDLPGRNIWFSLTLFPLLVPIPVLGIAWIMLLGPNAGWANIALRALTGFEGPGPLNVFSLPGLILCQSLASTPFAFIQFAAALRTMSPALEEAGAMAGAATMTTFRRITLPVLLPGLLAPIILVMLVTFEQFELPLIIGLPARINVFAYRIFSELTPSSGLPNYGGAAAVSLPFLGLGLMALWLYNRAIRNAGAFVTVTGKGYRQRRLPLGRWRAPAIAIDSLYVAFAAGLPAATLAWTSFFGFLPPGPEALAKFTWKNYADFVFSPVFWAAIRNSLTVAILSALIVSLLGGLIAWTVARSKLPGRKLLDAISFMSLGIPAVIAGLAVMVLYLSLPVGLYGTIWILVIAYSYRLATATRIARASLMQLHAELEEAAEMSGARWLTTQVRILLPLLRPALVSGFALVFIVGLREFTIPLLLYSPDNLVLSVLVWQLFQNGQPAPSAALGAMMIVLVFPLIFALRRTIAPESD